MNNGSESPFVFRLPNELLGTIFTLYTRGLLDQRSQENPSSTKDWLNFTHVCSRWRKIALKTPEIWAQPEFSVSSLPNFLHTVLLRSQSYPLTLKLVEEMPINATDVVRDHISHLAILDIYSVIEPKLGYDALREATSPAPLLHTINLRLPPYQEVDDPSDLFPDNFLGGEAPKLRHLTVRNCVSSASKITSLLRTLESLHLAGTYRRSTFDIALLANTPNLRVLDIIMADLKETNLRLLPGGGTIQLPQLTDLHLSLANPAVCMRMVKAITFARPPSSLKVHIYDCSEVSREALQGDIPALLNTVMPSHIQSLYLNGYQWNQGAVQGRSFNVLIFGFAPSEFLLSSSPSGPNIQFRPTIRLQQIPIRYLGELLTGLPLSALEEFVFSSGARGGLFDPAIVPHLQYLPNLRRLVLSNFKSREMIEALQKDASGTFSALKSLHLAGDFFVSLVGFSSARYMDTLMDGLVERRKAGKVLSKLTLTTDRVSEQDASRLRELVDEFESKP